MDTPRSTCRSAWLSWRTTRLTRGHGAPRARSSSDWLKPSWGLEPQIPSFPWFEGVTRGRLCNSLLQIAAELIFYVLHTHMQRSKVPDGFREAVCLEHRAILEQIKAGNPDQAEALMREHLANLTAVYEKIWEHGTGRASG